MTTMKIMAMIMNNDDKKFKNNNKMEMIMSKKYIYGIKMMIIVKITKMLMRKMMISV